MNSSNCNKPQLYAHSYEWIRHLLPIVSGYTSRLTLNWVSLLRALQNLSWDAHMWQFVSVRGFRGVRSLTLSKQRWRLTDSHMQYPSIYYRPILDILVRGLQQTFAFHGALRPLFLMRASSLAPIFLKRVYSKWMNFSTFLLNFFYWGGHVFSFGHPLLRQELEALNWSRKQWHIHEWLLVRSHFSTQMKRANERGAFFIRKLSSEWNCVCLFTHPIYHAATIHYLQRNKWPTIGLVDSSVNPWWFFFALPIPFTSVAVQMVSLRAVTVVKRWALASRA